PMPEVWHRILGEHLPWLKCLSEQHYALVRGSFILARRKPAAFEVAEAPCGDKCPAPEVGLERTTWLTDLINI
ncbi:hypothetical protein, partial [Pseudomonas aeruginosa]|uniref:hypothetical protein n=1 Tax=Pseudomonas aeruginosa TaxID=287 RepID=UPI001C12DE41